MRTRVACLWESSPHGSLHYAKKVSPTVAGNEECDQACTDLRCGALQANKAKWKKAMVGKKNFKGRKAWK